MSLGNYLASYLIHQGSAHCERYSFPGLSNKKSRISLGADPKQRPSMFSALLFLLVLLP